MAATSAITASELFWSYPAMPNRPFALHGATREIGWLDPRETQALILLAWYLRLLELQKILEPTSLRCQRRLEPL
jgi:hypothetical protein